MNEDESICSPLVGFGQVNKWLTGMRSCIIIGHSNLALTLSCFHCTSWVIELEDCSHMIVHQKRAPIDFSCIRFLIH